MDTLNYSLKVFVFETIEADVSHMAFVNLLITEGTTDGHEQTPFQSLPCVAP
jgi:hypothetical protein